MKLSLISAMSFLMLNSPFAFASETKHVSDVDDVKVVESIDNNTYFRQVENMFRNGRIASLSDLYGAHIGRCYTSTAPDKSIAAFYLMDYVGDDRNGPIGRNGYKAASRWNVGADPSYYDHMSFREIRELSGVLQESAVDWQNRYVYTRLNSGATSKVRKYSSYIVEAVGEANSTDHNVYCYYFIFRNAE